MRASDTLFGREVHEGSAEELPSLLKTRFPMGYYLILTDEESASALGKVLKRLLKKIFVVLREEDVLPLFSAPDAVTCVVGAGQSDRRRAVFCLRAFAAACRGVFFLSAAGAGRADRLGERVRGKCLLSRAAARFDFRGGFAEGGEGGGRSVPLRLCAFGTFLRPVSQAGPARREGGGKAAVFPPGRREPGNIGPAGAGERGAFSGGSRLRILFFRGISGRGDFCLRPPVGEICGPFAAAGAARMYRRAVRSVRPLFDGGFYRGGMVDYNARREEAKRLFPGAAGTERTAFPTAEQLAARKAAFEREKGEAGGPPFRLSCGVARAGRTGRGGDANGASAIASRIVGRRRNRGTDAGFRPFVRGKR